MMTAMIMTTVRIMPALFDEDEEDGTVYQLKYQPTKLDIELKYDELILEEGDSFCVRVYDDSGRM